MSAIFLVSLILYDVPGAGSLIALLGVSSPFLDESDELTISPFWTLFLFLQKDTMQHVIAIRMSNAIKLATLIPTMNHVMPSGPITYFSIQMYSSPVTAN